MLPDRFRQNLGYFNWLFNPFHGLDASGIYDLLSTSSPTEFGLYLNLGYWREATNTDEASDALAMLVANTAKISSEDTVLDCGFGFGDQDILWAQTLKPEPSSQSRVGASTDHWSHLTSLRSARTRERSCVDMQPFW